jgi:hypothetical protein
MNIPIVVNNQDTMILRDNFVHKPVSLKVKYWAKLPYGRSNASENLAGRQSQNIHGFLAIDPEQLHPQ